MYQGWASTNMGINVSLPSFWLFSVAVGTFVGSQEAILAHFGGPLSFYLSLSLWGMGGNLEEFKYLHSSEKH